MRSIFVRLSGAAALVALVFASGQGADAASSLFEAVRRDDVAAVRALVKVGVDVRTPDDTGTTSLMYAALYASPECAQALIDGGANVNAANAFGATALMWAATRTPMVEMLLARGADVDARASDGSTALVAAARAGNADAMRLMIAAGADTTSRATRTNLLTAAYGFHEADARDALKRAGIVPASALDFKGPVLARHLTNDIDPTVLARMLHAGANPREELPLITLSLPTFFVAARMGNLDAMRAFVAKGIDPTAAGPRGWTPLMLAAGGDTPSLPAMEYLLRAGTDVNAVDEDSRTALDWALTRGETEVSEFLRRAGGRTSAGVSPAPAAAASPRTAREAIERALMQLQPVGPKFNDRTKCNSCHNQNIPGVAIALARRQGLALDESIAWHSISATERAWKGRRELVLVGDTAGGGFQPNVSYGLLEMAEAFAPPTVASDAMAIGLAFRQKSDGSWPEGVDIRPPLTMSTMAATALAVRALREFAPPGRRAEFEVRVARGREYLRRTAANDAQDATFRLLGLVWAGAPAEEIADEKSHVLQFQRPDGGWAQLPTLASDAYATGITLYALHAAGMSATSDAYRKGTDYLRRTQLDDGTWFVRTRAFGFQPYFETGFPHGRSQFISTAATAWAAVALSYALE